MGKWLVKSDPENFSFADLRRVGTTAWDGVRNALAQQNLRRMELGDPVMVYHSGEDRAIVGLAEVVRETYLDPTDEKGKSACVDLKFVAAFKKPVTLAEIKSDPKLKNFDLVRISRLSVMPVGETHWKILMKMAEVSSDPNRAELFALMNRVAKRNRRIPDARIEAAISRAIKEVRDEKSRS